MRKLLPAALMSCLLLILAVPAGALAHSRGHHHSVRHARRHHRRHAVIQIRDFRASSAPAQSMPASPTSPTPPPEKAGTVMTFTGGVLTIKLNDNSTVSGKVTEDTDISCVSASAPQGDDDNGDGSQSRAHESWAGSGDQSQGGAAQSQGQSEEPGERDDQGQGDDQGEGSQGCTGNPLTEGATVLEAELAIGPNGSIWRQVAVLQ
jgi:hypothetical protein